MKKDFSEGARDSLPIAAGYFSVSFTFGIMAASMGIDPITSGIISLTNVTSAGQFAGIELISAGCSYIELFLTQLIINLRYGLMSLTLSQKLSEKTRLWQRFLIAFGNTDEIFAVGISEETITRSFFFGLSTLPAIGWTLGTFLGAFLGNVLPSSVMSALGLAIYGMFIAIVVPELKKNNKLILVVLLAAILSLCFKYLPFLNEVSSGISITVCAVVSAVVAALIFPRESEDENES